MNNNLNLLTAMEIIWVAKFSEGKRKSGELNTPVTFQFQK